MDMDMLYTTCWESVTGAVREWHGRSVLVNADGERVTMWRLNSEQRVAYEWHLLRGCSLARVPDACSLTKCGASQRGLVAVRRRDCCPRPTFCMIVAAARLSGGAAAPVAAHGAAALVSSAELGECSSARRMLGRCDTANWAAGKESSAPTRRRSLPLAI